MVHITTVMRSNTHSTASQKLCSPTNAIKVYLTVYKSLKNLGVSNEETYVFTLNETQKRAQIKNLEQIVKTGVNAQIFPNLSQKTLVLSPKSTDH